MSADGGFLGTLLLFLQLGNLCLRRRIALCCVPTPQHVLERRIGHSSPCREGGGGDEGGRGADMEEGRGMKGGERKGRRDGWRGGRDRGREVRGKGGVREGVGVSGGRGSEGTGREGDREERFEGRKGGKEGERGGGRGREGGREGSGK